MNKLIVNRVYKHFKGDLYIVLDIGKDSEDLEECVIYRGLYGDGPLWIRKKEDFLSEVDHNKYPDVKQKYRFELQKYKSNRK